MRLLSLVIFLCFSVFFAAAQSVSHSTIYSEDGYLFTVYLNGEQMNEEPQDRVRSINLSQPYYSILVDFVDESLPDIKRKIFQLTGGHGERVDATHIIKHGKKNKIVLRWKSQTTYPSYIEPPRDAPTVVFVGGGGTQEVVRQTTTTRTVEGTSDGVSMSFGGIGGRVNINTGNAEPVVEEVTTTTTVVNQPAVAANTSDLPCGGTILGTNDFEMALKSIASRSNDEGKMTSGKQIVSTNCFTTDQARRVVDLFQTEESKLEMAIYAYPFVIDKGAYFKMNGAFAKEESIDVLNKAILSE
ncbi:MAG: hypothetical protein ACI9EQ_001508 [Bacteroidia bacterium]|jgi:hypothetical protein